jgi:hypothetical protein
LQTLIELWPRIPHHVKESILCLVKVTAAPEIDSSSTSPSSDKR